MVEWYLCYAGSDDGVVTVWDLQTRQPIRTLQKAGKGAVTGLLVLDRPAFLTAGQGGRGDKSSSSAYSSIAKKGPPRPQPLAPFSKYYGSAGGLKPWDGVPVVVDGSTPYRCCLRSDAVNVMYDVCHGRTNMAYCSHPSFV